MSALSLTPESITDRPPLGKRLRLFVLNLQALLRGRRLLLAIVFSACLVGATVLIIDSGTPLPTLDAFENGTRRLEDAINEEAQINDATLYPSWPNRPPLFPEADAAHMHGRIGVSPDGVPSWVPAKPAFRMTQEQKREAHKGFCFNTRVSASLELDRQIPDYNSQRCLQQVWTSDLPQADVVIVFHNEDLSVLLRSVHSVLNRTPPSLLRSIILVNDASNATSHPWLFEDLPASLEFLPKTRLLHLTARRGLMMARMEGTKLATATVTVYLDSHIECTRRWLEPILAEIHREPKRMVTPMIHSIDPDNFEFESNAVAAVGFTWALGQTHPPRHNDGFTPIDSPVMAGGLFATGREWFKELGGYDPEMRLYGGEEMEIGFKVWQCGGSLVAHPCSRVGHVFRTDKFWKGQVYPVPFHEIIRNKRRTAEIWMDDYKELAFLVMAELPANSSLGPTDDLKARRAELNCRSFNWYLHNIFPEMRIPELTDSHTGSLSRNGVCLDTLQNTRNGPAGPYPCHGQHGSQSFLLDGQGHLYTAQSSFEACVEPADGGGLEIRSSCSNRWEWNEIGSVGDLEPGFGPEPKKPLPQGILRSVDKGGCLTLRFEPRALALEPCNAERNANQLWQWVP